METYFLSVSDGWTYYVWGVASGVVGLCLLWVLLKAVDEVVGGP